MVHEPAPEALERVVLARKAPESWMGFQWTGAEPEGMVDLEQAEYMGAVWEGDDLVTYNLRLFRHDWEHRMDGYLEDSD